MNTQQILELDELRAVMDELTQTERQKIARLLVRFGDKAEHKAQELWRRRKAPLAAYWFAKGVDARHFARALRLAPPPVLL